MRPRRRAPTIAVETRWIRYAREDSRCSIRVRSMSKLALMLNGLTSISPKYIEWLPPIAKRWCWLVIAVALAAVACRSEPRAGSLAGLAGQAKREGRTSISFVEAPAG
jgi:hypothetical protein